MTFEVFGEAATTADPGERAFDDPALGENDEAMQFGAFDDLEGPGAGPAQNGGQPGSLVAGIGEDAFDERKETARAAVEDQPRTVAVLHVGRMHDDVQQEPERVDQNVPLATLDLLARVIALRIDRRPPYCAPLALCASMMATLGLAARPAFSRVAT
jgi:hypothetical protein